jgi:hypothetical protein
MNAPQLPDDWIVRPALDAELKRYTLLSYLQKVKARFDDARFFPHLDDLITHVDMLAKLNDDLGRLRDAAPRDLIGFDTTTGDPIYSATVTDPDALGVIDEVIHFSLPELSAMVRHGRERVDEVLTCARFEPVGLLPLDLRAGYLLLREGGEAHAYAYEVSMLRNGDDAQQHRGVRTHYLASFPLSLANHYAAIKGALVRANRDLPNPATFLFEPAYALPRIETCLPIARRMVWNAVSAAA